MASIRLDAYFKSKQSHSMLISGPNSANIMGVERNHNFTTYNYAIEAVAKPEILEGRGEI